MDLKVKVSKLLPFLFLLFTGTIISAQDSQIDSMVMALQGMREDSVKVNAMNDIAAGVYRTDPDKAIKYSQEAKALAEQLNFPSGVALAYKNIGLGYYMQGNYVEASKNWESSMEIYEELGDDQMVANILNNLGSVYVTIGQNVLAIQSYLRALKMAEELGDSIRISTLLMNIGVVYFEMPGSLDSAQNYYIRAMEIGEEINYSDVVGMSSLNLGQVYFEEEKLDSARYYLEKSLTILTGNIDKSAALNIMGGIYSKKGEYALSIDYFQDALKLAREDSAQRETVNILLGLAGTYENMNDPRKAIEYYKEAESISEEIGLNQELSGAYEGLATNYARLFDYPNAYKYLSLQNTVDNAYYRSESDNETHNLMFDYQLEKKQNEIALLEQQAKIEQLMNKRQKAITIAIGILGLFLLAAAGGFFSRMQYIRKTNRKINAQKEQITDSIAYAQRIQSAILPSQELVDTLLPQNFVLFRPKDIVSGDFYWIKEVQDHIVIVGADCTGHGVPGAFMSMLGITMFNSLIGDRCFDAPGAILDRLRDRVKEMLAQQGNGDEQKDGMDIAIAVFSKNNRELHFSGAHNPLYIIRKKSVPVQNDLEPFASVENGEYRLFEIKGDKQPIGVHWEEKPFRTTSVYLKEQDSFYLFSDGFIDQFGGEDRKKFKSMNFKKLLLSVQGKEMELQKQTLEQTFDQWKGDFEQIDDVSVIGVRI
jgi:serine phosphatase RsbU (regulator of sigma subunit)/Tfp pilus assembly protein PilF